MTNIEILQKYDEAVSSFSAGLAAGLLDADQEKAFKEQYELFKAGRDALRRTAEDDKAREEGLTRGAELVKAESLIGKRLYVCWRGDTADQVHIRDISSVCITDGGKIALEDGPYDGFVCYMDEIGKWDYDKYVGLTRQEAEAALEGGDGE